MSGIRSRSGREDIGGAETGIRGFCLVCRELCMFVFYGGSKGEGEISCFGETKGRGREVCCMLRWVGSRVGI